MKSTSQAIKNSITSLIPSTNYYVQVSVAEQTWHSNSTPILLKSLMDSKTFSTSRKAYEY